MIWFAMRVRVRPCSERELRSSSGRVTTTWLSSMFTAIGDDTVRESSPFGPLTVTARPSIFTSTPPGISIGRRPIGEMDLPHVGENFSAHALLLGLAVCEQTAGGGQNRNTKPAEHSGQFGFLRVNPQTRLRHTLNARD